MMQRSDICKEVMNAKLLLMYKSAEGNKMMQCHAYDDVLHAMAGDKEDISQESLLKAGPYNSITVNKRDRKTVQEVKCS